MTCLGKKADGAAPARGKIQLDHRPFRLSYYVSKFLHLTHVIFEIFNFNFTLEFNPEHPEITEDLGNEQKVEDKSKFALKCSLFARKDRESKQKNLKCPQ
jgi:hypothetical protein